MRELEKRVDRLEAKARPLESSRWHMVTKQEGQSDDDAIDAFGREKIGADDTVIFLVPVSPRFDAEGKMILFRDWPENRSFTKRSAVALPVNTGQ